MEPYSWTKGEFERSRWFALLAPVLGQVLQAKLQTLVKTSAFDQGRALGNAAVPVLVQAVFLVLGAFAPEALAAEEGAEALVALEDVDGALDSEGAAVAVLQ